MNILYVISDDIAVGIVRGDVLARAINRNTGHRAVCKESVFLSDFFGFDVAVFQRSSTPKTLSDIEKMKGQGVFTIYDYDDDLLQVPNNLSKAYKYFAQPEVQEVMLQNMKACDHITVSTPELAHRVTSYGPTSVIRNCVDVGHAQLSVAPKKVFSGTTIMWHGSQAHLQDVPLVRTALLRVLREGKGDVRLALYGHFTRETLGAEFDGLPVSVEGWLSPLDLYRGLAEADIGLCPLIDTNFNRAKSEIKWLEYASVGVPCIVSYLDPYFGVRDGVDGLVIKGSDPEDWYVALRTLVDKSDYRQKLGLAAQVRMYKEYDSRERIREWLTLFSNRGLAT